MPLQSGTLLADRYRIERVLGHGGMGAVYLAVDENLGTPVAVKENLNVSPESERQFKREATLLASLRHPNLPRVTNHFVLGGQQYLVMDYVEGEDLKERVERLGPLPEADVRKWAAQLCDALNYMHSLTPPVVHRDIKPGNIKLTAQGDAMLVDFGIAKAASADAKTTTAAAAFTPGYAPPEQYGTARTDPRTDQYALAATLYRLLTDQMPPDSMERLLGNTQLIPPEHFRPDLSPALAAAIVRALELRPEDRFESVAKFKDVMLGNAPITQPTRMAAAVTPTVARATPATVAPTVVAAKRPGWFMPAAFGSFAIFILGAIALGAVLMRNGTGALATATRAVAVVASATDVPTETAPPPSPTPTPTAPPSDTPAPTETSSPPTDTPVPPTPTIIPTQVGSGGRIAFISNRDGEHFQVYTMNPDGSDVQPLTTDPREKWSADWTLGRLGALPGAMLAWSPDGSQLLYTAETSPGGPVDIWVINADGSNPVNLTAPDRAGRPNENDFQPAWCSDGTIAFTSIRNNYPQVFIVTLENRAARNYSTTRANAVEYNPLFFPDCRRMLLISTQNGAGELWRVFPFTAAESLMWAVFPQSGQYSYRPFLSELSQGNVILDASLAPNGTLVAYTRESPGNIGRNIIRATVEDSQLKMKFQQLTESKSDTTPQWSPDGNYLVFVSKRDGGREQIFRMLANGADEINLSNNAFTELSPAWQPALP